MRRVASFALALSLLLCILLVPGCAQRSATTGDAGEATARAGGASSAAPPADSSQPPEEGSQDNQTQTDGGAGGEAGSDASGQGEADTGDTQDAGAVVDTGVLTQPRTQQYGTCTSYVSQENGLNLRFNHPAGDISALDQAVVDWALQTAQNFRASLESEDAVSFSAGYDSYEVNGRVVGVLVTGSLSYSHAAAPQSVLATFNADRTTGQQLSLGDMLREGGEATLRQMVGERAGVDPNREDLFSNWLLSDTGLRIYLDGALAVEIPYIDLLGVLDLPQPERVIDPSKPMIALTFDDGPSKNTAHILDLLKFYNARATFYVVGNRVASYADTAQRAAAEGNELGNHTWEHAKLTALTPEEIAAQLTQTSQAVQQYTGYTITSVRPTGGACNDTVKTVAAQLGLYLVNWSVDTEDWKTRDADATYNAIMSGVSDGAIVLCHDLYESTASAMDRVIPELIAQGYQLVTVSELLSYTEGGPVPGTLYNHR